MKEEWRNIIVEGKVNEWYSVSNYGRCASHIKRIMRGRKGGCSRMIDLKQFKILKPVRKYQNPKRKDIVQCATHSFVFPFDFFEEWDYSKLKGSSDGRVIRNCKLHKVVIETFKPIDQFPPDRLKHDWDKAPESFKKWVKETALVNHIDHNPDNNSLDNLEYMTPRENTRASVKMYGRMCDKEKVLIGSKKSKPTNALSELLECEFK